MPSGKKFTREQKHRLFVFFRVFKKSADVVYRELFDCDPKKVSRKHLGYLKGFFDRADSSEIIDYITSCSTRNKGGRPRLMGEEDDKLLSKIIERNNGLSDTQLAYKLQTCLDQNEKPLSRLTILRSRKRCKITVKKFTRIHILADTTKQFEHYQMMAMYDPNRIINFDQTYHG